MIQSYIIPMNIDVNSKTCQKEMAALSQWKDVLKEVITSLKDRKTKINHKRLRALLKKEKRKLKRQIEAKSRDEHEGQNWRDVVSPAYHNRRAEEEREQRILDEYHEREKKRLHYLWLKREEQAAIDFKKKTELEKRYREEKEEQIKRNLEELKKLEILPEENSSNKEDICKNIISKLPEGTEPWHNPMAPKNYITGIMKDIKSCQFFSKTGACRFGERCSRSHERPAVSCTILIHNMFSHFSLDQAFRDEYDTDLTLEYEDSDTYQQFKEFYEDVLPEFRKLGKVIQFKVCCNQEPHLRGNVYVQFSSEIEATAAYRVFNGRWYASRQLTCEFSPVTEWKMAICGLFHTKRCPKGRTCNFLHVFRNPTNEFWAADKGVTESNSAPSSRRSNRQSRSRSPKWWSDRKRAMASSQYSHSKSSRRSRNTLSPDSSRASRRTRYKRSRRSHSRTPESNRSSRKMSHSATPESSRSRKRSKRSHSGSPESYRSSKRSKRSPSGSPESYKSSRRSKRSRSKTPEYCHSRSITPEFSSQTRKLHSKSRRSPEILTPSQKDSICSDVCNTENEELSSKQMEQENCGGKITSSKEIPSAFDSSETGNSQELNIETESQIHSQFLEKTLDPQLNKEAVVHLCNPSLISELETSASKISESVSPPNSTDQTTCQENSKHFNRKISHSKKSKKRKRNKKKSKRRKSYEKSQQSSSSDRSSIEFFSEK